MNEDNHKVRIGNKVFFYRQKAPFVESGMSILGALEYDEAEDKVRCHECGEWFNQIGGAHSQQRHSLTAREYKLKHGLNLSSSLVSERIRSNMIKSAKRLGCMPEDRQRLGTIAAASKTVVRRVRMEYHNSNRKCPAQLLADLAALGARLGRAPTHRECRAEGISLNSGYALWGKNFYSMAGLIPNTAGGGKRLYNANLLREMLIDFYTRHQRKPSSSDIRRGLLPKYDTFQKHFGSMANAYMEAGLLNPGIRDAA